MPRWIAGSRRRAQVAGQRAAGDNGRWRAAAIWQRVQVIGWVAGKAMEGIGWMDGIGWVVARGP